MLPSQVAIWLTRRNLIRSNGHVCAKLQFKQFVLSGLRVEKLMQKLKIEGSREYGQWAGRCVCTEEGYNPCIP